MLLPFKQWFLQYSRLLFSGSVTTRHLLYHFHIHQSLTRARAPEAWTARFSDSHPLAVQIRSCLKAYDGGGIELNGMNGSSQDLEPSYIHQSAPSGGKKLLILAKKTLAAARKLLNRMGSLYRKQVQKTFGELEGWRIRVLTVCFTSGLVLLINLIILLVAAVRYGGFQDAIATLARGEQDTIARMSTAYHILINVLSTLLLSCSSYTMQVLSSPTRSEVDAAHDKGQWLTIGLLSIRNLRHISRKRLILWLVLAASSIPLHLFYNSAVFKYTVAHEYDAKFVN